MFPASSLVPPEYIKAKNEDSEKNMPIIYVAILWSLKKAVIIMAHVKDDMTNAANIPTYLISNE